MRKTKTDTDTKEKLNVETGKKTEKNVRVKAADKEGNFFIQSGGNDYTIGNIKEMCVKAYRGNTRKKVNTIDVYVKFENGVLRAYYVVNSKSDGAYIEI